MARPAPAATRALALLDFLASRPGEAFRLSELSRALNVGVASVHALVNAMVQAGYLVRDEERHTYALGPAVIGIGHAALVRYPTVGIAREHMHRLSEEFDVECLASVPFGDEVVIVGRSGPAHPYRPLADVGSRLRMVPPLGVLYLAWDEEAVQGWIARMGAELDEPTLGEVRRQLRDVRTLGYAAGLRTDAGLRRLGTTAAGRLAVRPSALYRMAFVGAPVFDETAGVALVVSLDNFRAELTGAEVVSIAERLRDDMLAITRSTGGRPPEPLPSAPTPVTVVAER